MKHNILSYVLLASIICFTLTSCKKKELESPFKSDLSNATLTITTDGSIIEPTALEQQDLDKPVEESELTIAPQVETDSFIEPTPQLIQTALKSAGYYTGDVDGKIGPVSKKAILDFQKDNNLQVDGKVGPKTWAKLRAYLDAAKQN